MSKKHVSKSSKRNIGFLTHNPHVEFWGIFKSPLPSLLFYLVSVAMNLVSFRPWDPTKSVDFGRRRNIFLTMQSQDSGMSQQHLRPRGLNSAVKRVPKLQLESFSFLCLFWEDFKRRRAEEKRLQAIRSAQREKDIAAGLERRKRMFDFHRSKVERNISEWELKVDQIKKSKQEARARKLEMVKQSTISYI